MRGGHSVGVQSIGCHWLGKNVVACGSVEFPELYLGLKPASNMPWVGCVGVMGGWRFGFDWKGDWSSDAQRLGWKRIDTLQREHVFRIESVNGAQWWCIVFVLLGWLEMKTTWAGLRLLVGVV